MWTTELTWQFLQWNTNDTVLDYSFIKDILILIFQIFHVDPGAWILLAFCFCFLFLFEAEKIETKKMQHLIHSLNQKHNLQTHINMDKNNIKFIVNWNANMKIWLVHPKFPVNQFPLLTQI